jgi:ribosome biogenesis GTPase
VITAYGWSERLQRDFAPFAARGLSAARVIVQRRGRYRLAAEAGELPAQVSGRFAHEAPDDGWPVAGDWVAIEPQPDLAVIHGLVPRRTAFVRKAAGPKGGPQVVAANVDTALLAASLNADLNLRRLERYLALAYESGAEPVFVLTKADVCGDVGEAMAQVEAIAFGAPVLAVSAATGAGLAALDALLAPGRTAVLLGSSGVGKSTLVNALCGAERMATRAIREDDAHGRHTTTHRELIRLTSGALIVDTPGMRELGLWDAGEGVAQVFGDVTGEVAALAARCRFRDCRHEREPGCEVRAALADGRLDLDRWRSFQKLGRELAHEARRQDPLAREAERKRWIALHKSARQHMRSKRDPER